MFAFENVKLNIWVKDKNMKCIKITWKFKNENYNKKIEIYGTG